MFKDKPEMVVLPLNMAAILYNKGLPYQIQAITGWGSLFLIGMDNGISGWDDLRGRKIYVMGRGATPDILFKFLLQVNGLQPGRDVDLDYSFPTHIDLANAVAAGQAHLAVLPEPSVSLVRSKNPVVRIIMDLNRAWSQTSPEHPSLPQTALMVRKEILTPDTLFIRDILNRYRMSIDSVNRKPSAAAGKIVKAGILPDPAVAVAAIPGCNLEYRMAFEVYPEIKNYLSILYKFRPVTVGGRIPDEGFISK
jgi:NitT/TauT family transport system substrate-binding protein